MHEFMTNVSLGFEVVGVGVIIIGFVIALARAAVALTRPSPGRTAYEVLRSMFGRSILLGLEFLVAADLIRTVTVALTLENLFALGILVLIRTFLSFSLEVEIDGRWPWQRGKSGCRGRDPGLASTAALAGLAVAGLAVAADGVMATSASPESERCRCGSRPSRICRRPPASQRRSARRCS